MDKHLLNLAFTILRIPEISYNKNKQHMPNGCIFHVSTYKQGNWFSQVHRNDFTQISVPLTRQSEDKNAQNKHQYLAQIISSSKCILGQEVFIFPFILSNFILRRTFFLPFSKGAQPGMQSSAWSECLQNDHGTIHKKKKWYSLFINNSVQIT